MYTIYKVKIEGFWSSYKIETKFNDDINIFIGKNGTGKTTFINILQGVLTVNLELLSRLQFDKVEVTLKKGRSRKKIILEKIAEDLEYRSIIFRVGDEEFKLPFLDRYISRGMGRMHPKVLKVIEDIKQEIDNLYNISYLSVHRDLLDNDDDDLNLPLSKRVKTNTVEKRLRKLMNSLTSYQLQLETEINTLSSAFERNVLQSMLFDENIDVINLMEKRKIDVDTLQRGLINAYKDLNALNREVKGKIDQHVDRIKRAIKELNDFQTGGSVLEINNLIPLILLGRTERIIKFSKDTESRRTEIFKPIQDYLELLRSFITDKELIINLKGGLRVVKGEQAIHPSFLSSGEKQLIILLTEALLQEKKQFIYIADEPELSLHISWQRKIIPSLNQLNENAQLIIATHSPEIVGNKGDKIINMENILTNG